MVDDRSVKYELMDQSLPAAVLPHFSWRDRIEWMLNYEPTWFPECASGLGILVWSLCCFGTDDYNIHGKAWIMPCIGVLFGPVRWLLLFRLFYPPRVMAALGGAFFWAQIGSAGLARWGVAPMLGPVAAALALDVLTLAKFSFPCARELLADWRSRRDR